MKRELIIGLATISLAVLFSSNAVVGTALDSTDKPAVIAAFVPVYGPLARIAHVSGEVAVQVIVASSGSVLSVKTAAGQPLLVGTAKEASKQWRFASAEDSSINRTVTLIFVFTLMPRCASENDLTPIFFPPYKIEIRAETPQITCEDCSRKEREEMRCRNP